MIFFKNKINKQKYLLELGFFTAFAVTIYLAELLIPRPLPFLKIGLTNIVILLILINGNVKEALIIGVAKVIIGGAITGTIISPSTVLAVGAGIFSILIMSLCLRFNPGLSLLGISIVGAVAHNLMQISLVRIILITEDKIFYLTPLLIVLGIGTGIITGFITGKINDSLRVT